MNNQTWPKYYRDNFSIAFLESKEAQIEMAYEQHTGIPSTFHLFIKPEERTHHHDDHHDIFDLHPTNRFDNTSAVEYLSNNESDDEGYNDDDWDYDDYEEDHGDDWDCNDDYCGYEPDYMTDVLAAFETMEQFYKELAKDNRRKYPNEMFEFEADLFHIILGDYSTDWEWSAAEEAEWDAYQEDRIDPLSVHPQFPTKNSNRGLRRHQRRQILRKREGMSRRGSKNESLRSEEKNLMARRDAIKWERNHSKEMLLVYGHVRFWVMGPPITDNREQLRIEHDTREQLYEMAEVEATMKPGESLYAVYTNVIEHGVEWRKLFEKINAEIERELWSMIETDNYNFTMADDDEPDDYPYDDHLHDDPCYYDSY